MEELAQHIWQRIGVKVIHRNSKRTLTTSIVLIVCILPDKVDDTARLAYYLHECGK